MKTKNKNNVKFVFCIFSYGEDAYMLGQCVRALRRLGATRSNTYIFDDANNPLPYPIPNTQYRQTTFNRNGNLNGTECVDGELLCMYEASKETNAHVVVKVDSDVIINSLEWVTNNDFMNSHCGFRVCGKSHNNGACYSLPSWSLVPMLRLLKTIPKNNFIGESLVITDLAKMAGLDQVGYDCHTTTKIWKAASIANSSLNDQGTIEPRTLLLMHTLDVVLCDLIATTRNKYRNYLLMKGYNDFVEGNTTK